jgi:hypothetical protein
VINTSSASAKIVGKIDIDDLNHEKTYAPMRTAGRSPEFPA